MLAESYIGLGKIYKAYDVLKNSVSFQNRYKFALTCMKLKKWEEAEKALQGGRSSRSDIKNVPNGAAGLFLLAQC